MNVETPERSAGIPRSLPDPNASRILERPLPGAAIQDSVEDWRELSALYDQATALDAAAAPAWLAELEAKHHPLARRLRQMLDARVQAESGEFLRSLPGLESPPGQQELGWSEGSRVGPYRLLRLIGSGGMADVWLAERADGAFERRLAIKLVYSHPNRAQQEAFVERFSRERDILASLDHPNIAGLRDAGVTASGQPWLALDYVEGESITHWCDRRRLTIEERVRVFRQVFLAIEHAHARLVIHRDIKPSNVLVTESGEVRLLDFGISKLLDSPGESSVATDLTRAGGTPMTPQYASPEQLLGQPLTTACDVYSLGVVFYELLVGRLPYQLSARSVGGLEAEIAGVDPKAPSRRAVGAEQLELRSTTRQGLQRALRPDLDAIVLRALCKLPEQRYESVGAMRADVERWLAHEPVSATVPGPLYRLGKFIRRHRVGVTVAGAFVAVVSVAGVVTAMQSIRARNEAALAVTSKAFLLDMFRLSEPDQTKGVDIPAAQLLDASVDRANQSLVDQPELRAEVLRGIAEMDQHLGRYTRADSVLEQAAALYAGLGRRKAWAETQVDLADNAFQMGNAEKAGAIIAQAQPTIDEFSEDLALQARQHEVSGWIARNLGHIEAARSHLRASLEQATAVYGDKSKGVADALRGLASVEAQLHDYDAAIRSIDAARNATASSHGSNPLDLIGIEIERADLFFEAGRWAEAKPLLAAVATRCDSALGEGNERCFFAHYEEALLLMAIGSFHESAALLPGLLRESGNDLSPRRQAEASALAGRVLAANGMSQDRPDIRGRLMRIAEAGERDDPAGGDRPSAQLALAEMLLREGKNEDADRLLVTVLRDTGTAAASSRAYLARAQFFHGLSLQLSGKHAEALQALGAAEANFELAWGKAHTVPLLCQLNEVPSLVALGRSSEASDLIAHALPPLRARLPSGAPVLKAIERVQQSIKTPARGVPSSAGRAVFFG